MGNSPNRILFGEWDYVLTVVARDVEDYQRFVFDKLSKLPNIATYRVLKSQRLAGLVGPHLRAHDHSHV